MAEYCPPGLERGHGFHTTRLPQAREYFADCGFAFDALTREADRFEVRVDRACAAGTVLSYMQTGAPAELTFEEGKGQYWIALPVREGMESVVETRRLTLGPREAVISSPHRRFSLKTSGRGECFSIGVKESSLQQRLAALLGEPPREPLEFEASIDLSDGFSAHFAGHILRSMSDREGNTPSLAGPSAAESFADSLLIGLLLKQPHTYSERLRRLRRAASPRSVKRAMEFMEAHCDMPLTIGDIAEASGVAGRTLFKNFKDARGVSPIRYLRERRFQKANAELLGAEPDLGVTSLALRLGFSHLGRFAVEYRQRFGEAPSETLRKARARI